MHIPENYLSPSTCAVMTAAMLPVWGYSINKIRTEIPKAKMPLLGIGAAFSFLGMMFNVPLPGGTTGHAVGGTLIAILTGSPAAGCISVSIALLIQALLFGDGGILAFGANCFNMAFVLPYLGFFLYQLLLKKTGKRKLSAAIGAYVGINAAAFCAAVEFGIQPLLFKNVAGQALYCPYPLSVSIPAMMIGHITGRDCINSSCIGFCRKSFTCSTGQCSGEIFVQTTVHINWSTYRSDTDRTSRNRYCLGRMGRG